MPLYHKAATALSTSFKDVCGMWSRWWDASDKRSESHSAFLCTFSVTVFALLWFLYTIAKPKRANTQLLLPPGPRGLPIFGYLPFLDTHLYKTFTKLATVYGPIYKLWLGNQLVVVINSPSLAKEVVRDHDSVFANRVTSIASLLSSFGGNDIAIASYGPEWRKMRKLFVREMLSNTSLDACYGLRRKEVKKTIREVFNNKIGQPVDIGDLAFSTTISSIMNMLWGGTLEGEEGSENIRGEFRKAVSELMMLMGKPNVSDLFPILARFDLQGIERDTKRVMSWCESILDYAIERRANLVTTKEDGVGKKDFLQILLELKECDDSAMSITMTQLKGLLMDTVGGGTDTTSSTIEWVITELLQHPEMMKKVQEELNKVVGLNNMVEEHHLNSLRYLDAVVKEILRVHPPLPLLVPRCPSESCTVGGYTIPKGTMVFLNMLAMHKDPQLWDNPLEFRPERFMDDPKKFDYAGNDFKYMPFGSGRRICAGLPLAEKMLMYVLASLVHSFEWKLPYGAELDFSEKFGIVVKKMKPLVAIPTPRLSKLELYTQD